MIWLWLINQTFYMGSVHRLRSHGWITTIFLRFSLIVLCKSTQIIDQISNSDFGFLSWIIVLFSEKENSVFDVFNKIKFTKSNIRKFILFSFNFLEFLVWSFNDFIKVNNFKLFKCFFKLRVDDFVEFPQSFPETRVKVIFYTVITPLITAKLPSVQIFGNYGPFVAMLIV